MFLIKATFNYLTFFFIHIIIFLIILFFSFKKNDFSNLNLYYFSLILLLFISSIFPYMAVGKYTFITEVTNWTYRQALLLSIPYSIITMILFTNFLNIFKIFYFNSLVKLTLIIVIYFNSFFSFIFLFKIKLICIYIVVLLQILFYSLNQS